MRGSASHAVLALAAAAVLSGSAWAVDSGQTVNISSGGSTITVNGGTVVIDSSKSFGTDFALKDVTGNTIDIKGATATVSGKFTGSGGITITNSVAGTGALTLTNSDNDYTGITTINSGATLALYDSDTGSDTNATSGSIAHSQLLVNNGTFDISGAVNGVSLIALSGSGNIVLGSNSLTLYNYDSVADKTYDTNTTFSGVISGTGSFILSAGEITLTGVSTYTGATTVSNGTLHLSGSGSISQSANVVVYSTLDLVGANSAVFKSLSGSGTVNLGANDLVLNAASGSFAGIITGTGKLILNGGTEWLGGTSSFSQVVINAGTFESGSDAVTYNVANNGAYAFYSNNALAMSGVISGTGTVAKYGSGVTTISTAQTYSGATTISSGTIKLVDAGSIANSSGVQVDSILDLTEANGASIKALTGIGIVRLGTQSLTITNGNGDFSGTVTGSGGLSITGGVQSFSSANTYTGATSVNGGELLLVVGASLKSAVTLSGGGSLDISSGVISTGSATINSLGGTGNVSLGANTLVLAAAVDTFGGSISGTGGLWISGGTETLSGTSTYTGTTTVSAGTLILTGSLAPTSKLSVSGTFDATHAAGPTLTFVSLAGSGTVALGSKALVLNSVANGSTTFSGVISGSGSLTVNGAGTQVLSGKNTYTGGTTIGTGATLQIGNGSSTGEIVGNITDNGTLRFYRLDSTTFTGVISGDGAVIQGGIGTTILTADNTYTGGTTITAGTLQIGDGTSASGSILGDVVDGGTLAFARTGSTNIGAAISGAGNLAIKSGTIVLTGTSTYTGLTNVASNAELDLSGSASIAASDRVIVNGTFDISGTSAGASLVSLSGASTGAVKLGGQTLTLTAANDTFAGAISGTGGLTLAAGNETLSGVSTYSGATTVKAGALAVTGSIANSAVTVKSGGTLSGTGIIGGLSVESGGTVKAGANGTGTLTSTGSVTLASGSIYAVDVTSAGAAKLAVTGTAGLHGTLAITSSDGTYDLGNKLTIVTATGAIDYTGLTATSTFTGANSAVFKTTLDKQANALYLTINLSQLTPALGSTATLNQKHLVAGIDKAIAAGSLDTLNNTNHALAAGFEALGNDTADVLLADSTELAGEIGADTSLVAKSLFTPFLDAMSARTAMLRPLGKGQTRPLETWISAYGGTDIVDGDAAGTGAHKFRSNVEGVVAGAQWAPWSNTLIGGAISAGTSDFHIANNLGKGTATSIEAGAYGYVQTSRHIYNSFAAAVSATQIKTTRVITVAGTDTLTGKLTAFTFGGRYEAGIQLPWFTPYVGVQDHVTMLPGYTEGVATGSATTYALKYDSRTYNSGRAEIGLRHFIDVEVTPRWILTPDFTVHLNDRLAYAYDLSDGSQTGALFQALPSSDFTVYGAKPARHAVLATVGADVLFDNGLRLTTHLDTTFSQKSQVFTGFAGIGYTW